MAKKKKASSKKKKVGDVSVYTVEKIIIYQASVKRKGGDSIIALTADPDDAFDLAYKNAKLEREDRGLEQGDERVMFPQPIK